MRVRSGGVFAKSQCALSSACRPSLRCMFGLHFRLSEILRDQETLTHGSRRVTGSRSSRGRPVAMLMLPVLDDPLAVWARDVLPFEVVILPLVLSHEPLDVGNDVAVRA